MISVKNYLTIVKHAIDSLKWLSVTNCIVSYIASVVLKLTNLNYTCNPIMNLKLSVNSKMNVSSI
jgi:hypothetical protein